MGHGFNTGGQEERGEAADSVSVILDSSNCSKGRRLRGEGTCKRGIGRQVQRPRQSKRCERRISRPLAREIQAGQACVFDVFSLWRCRIFPSSLVYVCQSRTKMEWELNHHCLQARRPLTQLRQGWKAPPGEGHADKEWGTRHHPRRRGTSLAP
jgi:hypothetical protein